MSEPPPLAVVTGASSGIGAATARRLAARGYRTVLLARRADALRALADELGAFAQSTPWPLDLGDPDAVASAAARIGADHGPAAVLVNNGGGGGYRPLLAEEPDAHRRQMQIHYFAAVELIRALLPPMVERSAGHVINVASVAEKVGPWGHGSYAPAKSALLTLTQTLASEYGPRGVRFSCVSPGIVDTAFFSEPSYAPVAGRWLRRGIPPEKVARRIVGLLDRPRIEITVPRHHGVLGMIHALSPGLAQRIVGASSRPKRDELGDAPTGVP